ncbi:MAG: hypothetical protein Q8O89_00490 [Nanoarchaeota archaeon]|nr:hypothetical protein [Nanoarchaeota archaeon]
MDELIKAGLGFYGVIAAYDYALALLHYKRTIKNLNECDLRTEQENKFLKKHIKTFALLPFPLDGIYGSFTNQKYKQIRDKYCSTCRDVIEVRDENNLEKIVDTINPTLN